MFILKPILAVVLIASGIIFICMSTVCYHELAEYKIIPLWVHEKVLIKDRIVEKPIYKSDSSLRESEQIELQDITIQKMTDWAKSGLPTGWYQIQDSNGVVKTLTFCGEKEPPQFEPGMFIKKLIYKQWKDSTDKDCQEFISAKIGASK